MTTTVVVRLQLKQIWEWFLRKYFQKHCSGTTVLISLSLGSNIVYFNDRICIPFLAIWEHGTVMYSTKENSTEQFPSAESWITRFFSIFQSVMDLKNLSPTSRDYCLNTVDNDIKDHFDVSICITPDELRSFKINPRDYWDRVSFHGYAIVASMILSMPFLVVTLLVYIYLPQLHGTVQGKCFMCYLITQGSSFMATIFLTHGTSKWDPEVNYLFLCSFQWLNVIAFDVWWNVRSFK